jgi:hypothetical protein
MSSNFTRIMSLLPCDIPPGIALLVI